MSEYKISVCIPVYNSEKYLTESISALLAQTAPSIEFIFVNDGSTDGSLSILRDFERTHSSVRVVSQENKGVNAARAAAYRRSSGEYVAWMDNDDLAYPDMYSQLLDSAVSSDADVVICNYDFYPKEVNMKSKWYKPYRGLVDWRFVSHNTLLWNKLFKRSFIESIGFVKYIESIGEASFLLPLLMTNRIVTLDAALHRYRVGHGSQSSLSNIKWYENNYLMSLKRESSFIRAGVDGAWMPYLEYLTAFSLSQLLVVSAFNSNKSEYRKYRKLFLAKLRSCDGMFKDVVVEEYGCLKYSFLRHAVPRSFALTRLVSRMMGGS